MNTVYNELYVFVGFLIPSVTMAWAGIHLLHGHHVNYCDSI